MGREARAVAWSVREALAGDLLELIGLTGEPGFEDKLLSVVHAATGRQPMSAGPFEGEEPPRLLVAASAARAGDSDAVAWAELLLALIVKHDRLVRAEARAEPGHAVKERLLQAAPDLSDREAEVCALIAQGCGSEAIGLQLGISINTVKTYRRRAYGRLHISTQNELMRLALS